MKIQEKILVIVSDMIRYSTVMDYEFDSLFLDVDWYLPGDILQVMGRGTKVHILSSPVKRTTSFVYKIKTEGPLYLGDMLHRYSNSESVLSNERTDKLFRIRYNSKPSSFKKSDDFDTFITDPLLSPLSPISIWNNNDDYSSDSSSTSNDSYDSGFDCGGSGGVD